MGTFRIQVIGVMLLLILGVAVAPQKTPEAPADSITIKGAGATLVGPLFRRWFEQYHKDHPNVVVDWFHAARC